jgi:AraC family transcriptional regulator of adaptative response/methylated-DNA-[protein]-cysteine methyltransferase
MMMSTAAIHPMPTPADHRWKAVMARDATADGAFVYGVASTGIYCRPTCPSRRPRPDRVRFFDAPAEAERAGFRPCRRCRPEERNPVRTRAAAAVARASRYLRAHADQRVTLTRLSRVAGLSAAHLQRAFTRLVGLSPREYQAACRADRFRRALKAGRAVTEAIYEAGYGSPSRVYDARPTGTGVPPARYRKGGAGLQIRVSLAASTLGRVLVAATNEGVCAVKIGASDRPLLDELRRELPAADISADTPARTAWVRAVVARIDGRATSADVPLDVRGTAFQWQVWQALRRIPSGETRTYAELASAIGRPSATRAVARAIAANPVAVVIPCHRVVPKAGGTGGYRWGTERKRRLLDRE